MIMADVLKILLLVVGALVVTVSYWLLFEALFPRWVRAAQRAVHVRPVRTFLVGGLSAGPLLLFSLALLNAPGPVGKFAGSVVAVALVLGGLFGSAGLARLTGEGLPSPLDASQPWRLVLRGGAVLSICCVLPVVGWFCVLPVALVSGFGALVSAGWQFRRQRTTKRPEHLGEAGA